MTDWYTRCAYYRDTRGPGLDGFKALLAGAQAQRSVKGLRDVALIRLLRDIGLRCGEAVRLDLADVDLAGKRLIALGKGRSGKEPVTLPEPRAHGMDCGARPGGGAALSTSTAPRRARDASPAPRSIS